MRLASPLTSTSMKSIMQVAAFSPAHSGNFIASLRAAAAECKAIHCRYDRLAEILNEI